MNGNYMYKLTMSNKNKVANREKEILTIIIFVLFHLYVTFSWNKEVCLQNGCRGTWKILL